MTLDVAVVIPAYNGARFLRPAIESALNQTQPPSEIVLVDDGSTDETAEIAGCYSEITVLRQERAGVAAARNAGAAATTSPILAFLDADDVWRPTKLERQAEVLASESSVALVHVGVADVDANGRALREHLVGASGNVATRMLAFEEPVILGGGSGAVIRRSSFDEVGGFDNSLSTSADWDLYYRIACRHTVAFVPEVLLDYRIHDSNMHANVEVMERDMLRAFDKALALADRRTRRRAYGRLHLVLAGSYFRKHALKHWARHQLKAAALAPDTLVHAALLPVRAVRRAR